MKGAKRRKRTIFKCCVFTDRVKVCHKLCGQACTMLFFSSKSFPIVLPSFGGCTTQEKQKIWKSSDHWPRHPGNRLLKTAASALRTKYQIHRRGKVWSKSCWKWFKLIFQIFLFLRNSKMKKIGPKNLHFSEFNIKKNGNSNLDHFEHILFHTFPLWW